ncbi:putative aminopeptidase [Natranaerofaba carboxydovora]|nr:putative aminopeptidase [Natranaerofaba carboxydovora]
MVLCPDGSVCSCDIRGGAPGTRETDLLNPVNAVQGFNALVFSGGSAYGLESSHGVMEYLEENNTGIITPSGIVPIVSQAILYDLDVIDNKVRPDSKMGKKAVKKAKEENGYIEEGSFGAGTGATVGKILGTKNSTKGGIGTFSTKISREVKVGALVVVNSFGDVISEVGNILAGPRKSNNDFVSTIDVLEGSDGGGGFGGLGVNTTLACVATDASLDKSQAKKIAQSAHNGIARAIRPSHTMFDGDSVFTISTGEKKDCTVDINLLGYYAALTVEKSIRNAISNAKGIGGIPAYSEI